MKCYMALLQKFEVCKLVEKYMEDTDLFRLKERMKPFQKEGYAIIDILVRYI